jgi:hypothetical protein
MLGEKRNSYRFLVEKPEGRPLGRTRYGWEDNIRMDLGERGWGGRDQIHLAQDRGQWWAFANMVINLVP